VTLATWQILKVLQAVRQAGGRLTLGGLAALVRGGRKGSFDVAVKRRGKAAGDAAGKGSVDLDDLVGGPVEMKKLVGCFFLTISFSFFLLSFCPL
jgi:ATP-dependent DNA helicase Q1